MFGATRPINTISPLAAKRGVDMLPRNWDYGVNFDVTGRGARSPRWGRGGCGQRIMQLGIVDAKSISLCRGEPIASCPRALCDGYRVDQQRAAVRSRYRAARSEGAR